MLVNTKNILFVRVFIRHRRSENSPSTTQNSPVKFRSFPERALLFHNNSPATLHCSPATTILMKTLICVRTNKTTQSKLVSAKKASTVFRRKIYNF